MKPRLIVPSSQTYDLAVAHAVLFGGAAIDDVIGVENWGGQYRVRIYELGTGSVREHCVSLEEIAKYVPVN